MSVLREDAEQELSLGLTEAAPGAELMVEILGVLLMLVLVSLKLLELSFLDDLEER